MSVGLVWCSSAGRRVAGRELRDLLRGGGASPPSSDSPLEARLMHVSPRFSHDYCPPDIFGVRFEAGVRTRTQPQLRCTK